MLTFSQYLKEAGDFHYPFEKVKLQYGPAYTFHSKSRKYIVLPQEKDENRKLHVTFMTDTGQVGRTGKVGADAGKILSTVHNIIKHHITRQPNNIHTVVFTSDNREASRQRLYDRYTAKLGGHSVPGKYETTHHIPSSAYKSEG